MVTDDRFSVCPHRKVLCEAEMVFGPTRRLSLWHHSAFSPLKLALFEQGASAAE